MIGSYTLGFPSDEHGFLAGVVAGDLEAESSLFWYSSRDSPFRLHAGRLESLAAKCSNPLLTLAGWYSRETQQAIAGSHAVVNHRRPARNSRVRQAVESVLDLGGWYPQAQELCD